MTRVGKSVAIGALALAALGPLAGGRQAQADWLVTRGMTRFETSGAWRVEGSRVVFTDLQGRSVVLPVALLDLEASRQATAEAARHSGAPAAPGQSEGPRGSASDTADGASEPEDGQPRVTLYSTSWCGWCRKTRALLETLGVRYAELDVDRDAAARSALLKLTGGSLGVPVLDVGGTVVRGYVPDRIRALVAAWPAPPPQPATQDD